MKNGFLKLDSADKTCHAQIILIFTGVLPILMGITPGQHGDNRGIEGE